MRTGIPGVLVKVCGAALLMPALLWASSARDLVAWLDLPADWSRSVENNVVVAVPGDLAPGNSLLFLIEPPVPEGGALESDYEKALVDLGPWTPVHQPIQQSLPNGWGFRQGVGVTQLEGTTYTALTAVARLGSLRARFWVLADSDDTYNRYESIFVNAIGSVQDFTHPVSASTAPSVSAPVKAPPIKSHQLDPEFGKGLSGVYVGVERGLSASAGVGSGQQQIFNPSTGRYETSNLGTAPQVQTQISDYLEVDVFYPDGTYRRRLPVRGIASDFSWERQQQRILWGTWRREGRRVIVQRGSYTTTYTIENDHTLISDRGRPWMKISPHSGKRFQGTYARADYRDASAPRLVLRADGSYEDRGDIMRMIGSGWNLVVPDGGVMLSRWSEAEARRAMAGGSGTYTYENFTLTLRDRDGRMWQTSAYVPPGETLPGPARLVVNGRALVRE
ncbi:MAG: hypothetical protein DWQ09_17830 [Proteobacteria bacterium]|nr:MAG: hypothetical protein DWQ09_17830 [Pseudomonadota bacterium]